MDHNCGKKGLANLGNTCYMNSCLQCLSQLDYFNPRNEDYLDECQKRDCIDNDTLINEWNQLMINVWKNDKASFVNPQSFLRKMISEIHREKKIFDNFSQNDVSEFLTLLLELFHKDLKKKVTINVNGNPKTPSDKIAFRALNQWKKDFENSYSCIIKNFYSQMITFTSCTECDYITTNHEPFVVLNIEIPQNANSIEDCLRRHTESNELDCDNQWLCDKCNQRVSPKRKIMLWDTTDILIVCLKRFTENLTKNNKHIQFSDTLNIKDLSINYTEKSTNYKLIGVCIQSGGIGGGHYYAICRHNKDGVWRCYNDSTVREYTDDKLYSESPYCFFYQRKKS